MLTVEGRILTSPSVSYAANKSASPSSGFWNMIQQRFSTGAWIRNWSYFKIQFDDKDPLDPPLTGLMMESCGLRVEEPNLAPGFAVLK